MKNKLFLTSVLFLLLVGCQKNQQIKAVVNDFNATPRCNVKPILTHESDTKDSLKAKVLILNDRVACMKDWYYWFNQKVKSYLDI